MNHGSDPSPIPQDVAFASWMRDHFANSRVNLDVIRQGGWEEMQWDRALAAMEQHETHLSRRIDTSKLTPNEVAELVAH